MANNINTLTANSGTVQSGATVVGANNKEYSLPSLNKAASISSGASRDTNKVHASESYLNSVASVASGARRSAVSSSDETEKNLPSPDVDVYNEFLATVGQYVKMSDAEKEYYYKMSGVVKKNGGDVNAWAQDFLSTNAVANALGISRSEVLSNRSVMLNYYLGIEDQPLTFTTAASLLNAANQGQRQQYMAEGQEKLLELYKQGYDESSPEIQQITANINNIQREMDRHEDSTPRAWMTEWTQNALSQVSYMLDGSISGIAGSIIGGTVGAIGGGAAGAVKGMQIGSAIARFSTYQKQFEASAFWNMKQSGISTETALKYSAIDGLINGLNEAFLDVGYSALMGGLGKVVGIKDLGGKFIPSMVNKVIKNGSLGQFLGKFFLYMGLDAGGEFVQESTQSLTSSFLESLAERAEGLGYAGLNAQDWKDALNEGIQGFATGLFFGIYSGAFNIAADTKTATSLKNRAIHSLSEESFVNNKQNRTAVQNLRLGGSELSEEQISDQLSGLYHSTQTAREDLKNNIRPELFEQLKTIDGTLNEDVLNNVIISDKEIKNEKGEVISGKGTDIKTKDDGSLYFVVDNVTPDNDGKTATYTMRIANPNVVGTSQMGEAYVDAQTAGITNSDTINSLKTSPASLAMEQAGKITFTVNEETGSLTIDSVQIQNDSSSLKKQAIQELVDMYPEYTVEWQNQTESDKAVFSDIESGNPRNTSQKTYGLNYREKISSDDADTAYVKRWLGNKFSEDNSENSLMATIVQAAAKARGLSGKEFIEKYLNEIQDSALDNDPNAKGYTKTERDAVTKQVKATIYAGKNADPSTFLHELHHTIMLMDENMKEFSDIYQKVKNTKQFRAWLEKNRDIILNSSSVRNAIAEKDKDGNLVRDAKGRVLIDASKLDSLFSSGDKWTTAEFELEARIYEAYMRSGQTFNPTLTGFFRRVAETFRQIYRSLRNGFSSVRLNDEVVEYFDKLYGYDKQTGTTSKLSGSGELTHLSDRLEKGEKTDTLKQGTETDEEEKEEVSKLSASEQYRAVREQYYGTDKYMIAPNGKASNLSERQWIQVRTPNFLEWGGDWINDPEHASVILDENGEPKQLYHGSPSTGIEIFNNSERSINGGEKGFTYLTDNANVADRFSREFEEGSSAFRVRPTGRVGEVYSLYAKMANPLDFRNLTEQNKNDIAETYVDDVFGADAEDRSYQIELTKNSMENALRYENYQLVKDYAESYLGNLSSYGYDGIIAPMGTRGELKDSLEYAVASPNQVKSVNNNGEFSLEDDSILKQEVEDALMQFIGEVGASNVEELPDALNNLSIAKQMEWSGMGEQYIWATTGWVKGADGKWRMEIPDIINNLDFDNEKGIYERYEDYYPYPLKDFINEKIVRIYPQLSDYKIMFYSGSDVNEEGAYSDKTIRINTSYFSEIKNTLVHELQHAIQEIEGFQNGGNPQEIDSLVKSKISELQKIVNKNEEYIAPYRELNRALSDYITWVKALENPDKNVRKSRLYMEYGDWYVSKNKKEAHQQYLDAIEKAEPYYREQRENLTRMLSSSSLLDSKLIPEEYAYKSLTDISMDELSALQKSVYGKMERLAKGLGLYEKAADLAQYLSLGEYSASDIYRKLQGEVEARNATTRYNLNVHVSLPRKTEDISREEQFRIVDGDILKQEADILFQNEVPEDFSEQLDSITKNDIGTSRNQTIVFATETPSVFLNLGLKNLPIEMFKDKIARAFFLDSSEKHGHKDSMNNKVLENVARQLNNPIAVFKSATVKDAFVALYDVNDLKNHMVMVSLAPNKKQNFHEINLITSAYGRNNEQVYGQWISDGLLLYYDDKKTRKLTVKLQLPSDASLSKNNVLTKSQLVNNFVTENEDILKQEDDTQKKKEPKYKTVDEAEAALTEYRNKNGFKIKEGSIRVDASDVHELYRIAEDARGEFSETISNLKKELGVPDNMAFSRPVLKGFDRVIEKAVNDYDGDVGRVIDVNGATFESDTYAQAESYFNKVISILGDRVVKKKKCITPAGYKDFKVNFRTSNGFIGELIILDEDTAWMKNNGIGHTIYDEARRLEPYLKEDKEIYKEYQTLFGMDVWNAIKRLSLSLDEWSSTAYSNAKAIRNGQYDNAGFEANLYAVSSDITELSRQLRSNFDASYSVGLSEYTLPSEATLSTDSSQVSSSLLNGVSQISKYLTAIETLHNQNVAQLETEVKNKAELDAMQSQSEENIRAVAVSGDSLKQISDAEWVETAKRIALQAPSLEEFFRLYREQVENGDAEVSDLDTQMILSNLYRGEHLTDYSEDYYSDYEEDAPSSIDEEDDWTVEGPDDEDMEGSATSSYSDEPMPDDWLIEDDNTATASDDDWVVEGPGDEGTPSSATSSSDSSDMPDKVPDWFFGEDEVAETENSATETEQTIKDMEDAVTEVQKVVVDSDLPKKLSLDHSRSLDTSIKARAVEFSSILSASKEETIKFLQTLKEVNAEFFYNEPRIDPQLVTEEDVADEAVRRTAYDEFDSISKFIQNLIYDSKGAKVSRDLTKLSDRAWKIVAGQVAKNAEVYMDLYARASNNTEWAGDNSIEAKVLTELGITERDWNNASFYRRKMYLQDIADKQLREKISSGQVYDKELREYLARAEEKAEASLAEAKAIEESQKYIIEENKKTILKLSTEAKDAVDKISDLQKEQEEVQGKIDRLVIRMEQKLKKQGQSIEKETLDHDELIRRHNALKRREAQYRNALEAWQNKNLKKADTQTLTADLDKARALVEDAKNRITALLEKNALTPDEALERLENLYRAWHNKDLADKIQEVKDTYKDKLKQATKDKNDALKKQYTKVSDHYKNRLLQATKDKNDALKDAHKAYMQAMKERDAIRKIRAEKERLARQIMKRPSGNVALEEAKQIRATQALIDPNFRAKSMKTIDGVQYTVEELKRMLNNNPNDPVFQTLTERQLERLTKTSLDEMTLAEVECVYQYINKLKEDGLNKRRNEILQRKSENQIIYTSLMNALRNNPKFSMYGFEGTEDKKNRQNTKRNKIRDAWYQTLNMARKAQTLDNGEKGVFYDLLIRKKRLLQKEEMQNVMARSKKIEDIIKENKLGDSLYKTWSVKLEDGRSVTFTTSELAYIYFSQNCEDNRDAIAYGTLINVEERANIVNAAEKAIIGTGKGVTDARNSKVDADIRSLGDWRYNTVLKLATDVITKDKGIYTLVKAIESDFNDPSFNRVVDLVRRLYNVEVQKMNYYLPLNRTDFLGKEPGEELKNDLLNQVPGTRGNVQKGFTKDRQVIAPRNQKAVKYDLFKVWTNAVKNQEHFLAMQEYVNQLNSIFVTSNTKTNTLRANIENTYGQEMLNAIDTHIKEIADPNAGAVQSDPARDILKAAKGNIYSAYLGFKLSGITNQLITSPAAFFGKVGPVRYAKNLLQMVNPVTFKKTREEVFNLSPFMKSRNFDVIAGEIKDAATQVGMPKYKKAWYNFLDFGLSGLEWADQVTVVAGWKAIYEQELERLGGTTADNVRQAIQVADEYVQETQPQSDKTEIAPLYKNKNEMLNILLQFQSSLNVIWNNLAYDTVNNFKKKNWRTAFGTIFGYATAGALLSLAHGDFKPDDDDDDYSFWRTFLYSVTSQGVESIPVFSSYVDSIFGYVVNNEKPGYNTTSITPFPMLAEAFNSGKYTVQAIKEQSTEYLGKAIEKGANALMLGTGLPYSGIKELQAIQDTGLQALIGARDD